MKSSWVNRLKEFSHCQISLSPIKVVGIDNGERLFYHVFRRKYSLASSPRLHPVRVLRRRCLKYELNLNLVTYRLPIPAASITKLVDCVILSVILFLMGSVSACKFYILRVRNKNYTPKWS